MDSEDQQRKEFLELIGDPNEKLHPELEAALHKGPMGQMIGHPLVHEVFYIPTMHGLYNKRLEYKKKGIEEALEKRDWGSFVGLHEKPYRLEKFLERYEDVTKNRKEYWEALGFIWSDSENIWQYLAEWEYILTDGEGDPDAKYFMDDEERHRFGLLPDVITIYRGCHKGRNEDGLSYSLSKQKAEWFAKRFSSRKGERKVNKLTLPKSECFAFVGGREEEEIIIRPR
jgi:hypothetical protein